MASRLRSRLKQLHKNMGMIPIDAKRREEEDRLLNLDMARCEDIAADAMEELLKRERAGRGIGYCRPPMDLERLEASIQNARASAIERRKAAGVST